jgi:hypothetical protein
MYALLSAVQRIPQTGDGVLFSVRGVGSGPNIRIFWDKIPGGVWVVSLPVGSESLIPPPVAASRPHPAQIPPFGRFPRQWSSTQVHRNSRDARCFPPVPDSVELPDVVPSRPCSCFACMRAVTAGKVADPRTEHTGVRALVYRLEQTGKL